MRMTHPEVEDPTADETPDEKRQRERAEAEERRKKAAADYEERRREEAADAEARRKAARQARTDG